MHAPNPPPPLRGFLVLSLVIVAAIAGHFFGQHMRPASVVPPLVLMDRDAVLGELRLDEKSVRRLTIANHTRETVLVSRIFGDCRCVKFRPSTFTIPAQGQVEIEMDVVATETNRTADRLELQIGVDAEAETIGRHQVSWRIAGKLVREMEWEAPALTLGEVAESDRTQTKSTLRFSAKEPIEWMEARSSHPAFRATIHRDGQRGQIEVVPSEPTQGVVHATLFIEAQFQGKPEPRHYKIAVQAYFLPEIELSPERLLSGIRSVGEVVEEEVRITSRSGTPFTMLRFGTEGKGITITPREGTNVAEHRFDIRYQITQPGFREQTTWFEIQRPGQAVQRLTLPLQQIGREP
jgi:hypothetical protein